MSCTRLVPGCPSVLAPSNQVFGAARPRTAAAQMLGTRRERLTQVKRLLVPVMQCNNRQQGPYGVLGMDHVPSWDATPSPVQPRRRRGRPGEAAAAIGADLSNLQARPWSGLSRIDLDKILGKNGIWRGLNGSLADMSMDTLQAHTLAG